MKWLEVAFITIAVAVLISAPFGIVWMYAVWGGDCIARGGQIVGDATSTRCEGSR